MRPIAFAAVLLAALASAGAAQSNPETGQEVWIAPSHPIAVGAAPGVKVQLLGSNGGQKTYAVIFAKDDEVLSGLTDFANQYHITAAHFTAIGALENGQLGWLSPVHHQYRQILIPSQVEVASMIGDIALYNGKPVVHTHMVVSFPDGSTKAGHVLEAHVNPTLEVMVTVEPNAMHKRLNADAGMAVIDPALKD